MSIQRFSTSARMSEIVVFNGVVYLAGQVGEPQSSIEDQTAQALEAVEGLLIRAGSSKEHILQTTIWLADLDDFERMNSVWDAWVPNGHAPARACGESKLANPNLKVEVIVTAAVIS